jgi:hypothetical protein
MNTLINRNTGIAGFAAIVIVGLSGLTLERGHAGSLPQGVIEVGNLVTLSVGDLVVAQLPEVQVLGTRVVQLADAAGHADPQG